MVALTPVDREQRDDLKQYAPKNCLLWFCKKLYRSAIGMANNIEYKCDQCILTFKEKFKDQSMLLIYTENVCTVEKYLQERKY